jgi:arginine decarboxylase
MEILISSGIGNGPTALAAFDAALNHSGVANYNLIRLSSVIPPDSIIVEKERKSPMVKEWGYKLYVVMADMRVDTPNAEAWAGIGWVQDKETGKGLFAEHIGNSEKTVVEDITQSLNAFMATRNIDFGPIHMKTIGKTCKFNPVCALVIATYQSDDWKS